MTISLLQSIRCIGPDEFETLGAEPGVEALARGEDGRLLWYNDAFAEALQIKRPALVGSLVADLMPPAMADERREFMRPVIELDHTVHIVELLRGRRTLTSCRPLDAHAIGQHGVFVVSRAFPQALVHPNASTPCVVIRLACEGQLGDLGIFTRRELEILRLVADGMSNRQIGRALFRSIKTVANQLSAVLKKTGSTSRTSLARYGLDRGLTGFSIAEWSNFASDVARRPHPHAAVLRCAPILASRAASGHSTQSGPFDPARAAAGWPGR